MKIVAVLILILLLNTSVIKAEVIRRENTKVFKAFRSICIDLNSKSNKSWIRILSSEDKRMSYGLYFDLQEIELFIEELKSLEEQKVQGDLK